MINDKDKFGIIMILPECAFTSELDRTTISGMMKTIDASLTEQGAPEDQETRSELMMENLLSISSMLGSHDHESNFAAYSNIAYSFLYSFGVQIGFENVVPLRGLTGTFLRNRIVINPCLSEADYQREYAYLGKKMSDRQDGIDDEWDVTLSLQPTVH